MKKILAAIDGLKYSQNTTDFAVQLASEMEAELVGVFLDDYSYHSYKIYDLVGEEGAVSEKQKYIYDEQDKESRQRSASFFEACCVKAGLTYSIHHDRNFAMRELVHESMFADLLIIDCRETFTHYEENLPTEFVRSILAQVECPVILVPGQYEPFQKVSLLYDGKPSSLYAIKMFSYLFPDLKQKEVEIIRVNRSAKTKQNPDNRLMKEFLKRHFPNASYTLLNGLPEPEIVNYLKQQGRDQLIVLGAYRRSRVSRWIKPSLADGLMKQLGYPLFIAHH